MSDTGGGHRSVALAVEAGLREVSDDQCDVRIVDIFAQGKRTVFDRFTRLYGPTIRYAPQLYGLIYSLSDDPRRYAALYTQLGRRIAERTAEVLQAERPDVVVSAHPLGNRVLLDARSLAGLKTPIVAIVTELVSVHTSWVEDGIDLYVAATSGTYQALIERGVPPDRVRLLGLPVGPRFGRVPVSRASLRRKLQLMPDRFTVLLIGGGEGVGLRPIVEAIDEAALDCQLVVICGRNERLRQQLDESSVSVPMRVLGFVTNVPELMHASDVVITKGGPQTISEALVSGLPVIVTHELPGQERGNARFVEDNGAGFAAFTPQRVVAVLRQLASDPVERARIAANARALGHPNAARDIARAILDLARQPVAGA